MMRRTVGIMFAVALAFVLGCGVVAAGSEPVSGSLTAARAITQKVDLDVNVDKWAAIEIDNSEPMALELERPEASARVSRAITVKANTKVSVSVDKPALYLSQDDAGELSEARKYPDNGYALYFAKSDRIDQAIRDTSYDLNPGTDTRYLVFWAEWDNENDDWYQLLAGKYEGQATITVSAK